MSISVIISTGQGQGQVTKGHERSPNLKILFWPCDTCFLGTFARRVEKSKPFCNLTPKKSTIEKGQVNPRVTQGQIFNKLAFSNHKDVFLNKFDLRIPKMSFLLLSDV